MAPKQASQLSRTVRVSRASGFIGRHTAFQSGTQAPNTLPTSLGAVPHSYDSVRSNLLFLSSSRAMRFGQCLQPVREENTLDFAKVGLVAGGVQTPRSGRAVQNDRRLRSTRLRLRAG
jgi:hypothetical protein